MRLDFLKSALPLSLCIIPLLCGCTFFSMEAIDPCFAPTVTMFVDATLSPTSGSANGDTLLTITLPQGSEVETPSVTVGGETCSYPTRITSRILTCESPAGAIGPTKVLVRSQATCFRTQDYTYLRPDIWTPISTTGAPSGLQNQAAIWSGTELLLWGGDDGVSAVSSTGYRYRPDTNSWTTMSTVGAPTARSLAAAIWTGNKMLIWGGVDASLTPLQSGALYDPAADSWTTMNTASAPSARDAFGYAWSGSKFFVWGGDNGTTEFNSGAMYDPETNTWTTISTSGAPSQRSAPFIAWTGSQFLVFGGRLIDLAGSKKDGALYDPILNTWTAIADGLDTRLFAQGVWTGSGVLMNGGIGSAGIGLQPAFYDLASNSWSFLSTAGSPSPRWLSSLVWSGTQAMTYGGTESLGSPTSALSGGGIFQLRKNAWRALATEGAPSARILPVSFWTGRQMIVWGGVTRQSPSVDIVSDGALYTP